MLLFAYHLPQNLNKRNEDKKTMLKQDKINLQLNPITAKIIADLLEYDRHQLKRAEEKDEFLDNSYLIKAIDDFLSIYELNKD